MDLSIMSDLFTQLRQAHRICASAYRRILPSTKVIPDLLDVEFNGWFPHSYDEAKKKKPVCHACGEAFLPLYDSIHIYVRNPHKITVTPTSASVVAVRFVMDTAGACDIDDRVDEFNERAGEDILSDPLESKSLVIFYIYRPAKRIRVNDLLTDLFYSDDDYPYPGEDSYFDETGRIQVANLVYDMNEWVADPQRILNEVRVFIDSDVTE